MTSFETLEQLASIQAALCQLLEPLSDAECREHCHPDLSPLSWHLGHCAFIELYWLSEVVRADACRTAALHRTYFPELAPPKAERAARLPPRNQLLDWAQSLQAESRSVLVEADEGTHPLLGDGYLARFLIQHNCQHFETMQMAITQQALQHLDRNYTVRDALTAASLNADCRSVASGEYTIGTHDNAAAYDNELPPHPVHLDGFRIARRPVSNAEFLAFMNDGGYENPAWWSDTGWHWTLATRVSHPDHWRRDRAGRWYEVAATGARDLAPTAAVMGINHHEASAFAAWASAQLTGTDAAVRLPHEYEWEVALRNGSVEATGQAWEWCANTFHPYPEFRAFPYAGYSRPWFDGNHYVLRGGSSYTRAGIQRPGFRNFYQPDKRHIFAGLRLVFA